jgi:hypothetical protein
MFIQDVEARPSIRYSKEKEKMRGTRWLKKIMLSWAIVLLIAEL